MLKLCLENLLPSDNPLNQFARVKSFLFIFLVMISVLIIMGCSSALNFRPDNSAELTETIPPEFEALFEAYGLLEDHSLSQKTLDNPNLTGGAIRGMLQALDDPYAAYIDPETFSVERDRFRGEFEGIGAEVGIENGHIIIVAPIPDTPAEKAGLRSGDIILEVDGLSTEGMSLFEVVSKIRGPKNTAVDLLILHSDEDSPVNIKIIRGIVDLPSVTSRQIENDITYVKLSSFTNHTHDELDIILKNISQTNQRGLLLDLRNNAGGLVESVVNIASQFLDSGMIMYQVDGQGVREDYEVKSGGKAREIPMVVLVNDYSASASEILAGALRDHGRAKLIGTTTYGKGSVNIQTELSNGGGIFFTIARWYTPNGVLIEGNGIQPDFVVQPDQDSVEDLQLNKAIEVLEQLLEAIAYLK